MGNGRTTTILESVDRHCILFMDIETVPMVPDFESLPEAYKPLWLHKAKSFKDKSGGEQTLTPEELFFEKAGLYAEFAKIVCISIGCYVQNKETNAEQLRITSFYGHDEAALLERFKGVLDKSYNNCDKHILCAHNGTGFDFPVTARRFIINNIALPKLLNVSGMKSWNNKWLMDTMELWRFGAYGESASLNLLAACLGIPSPKDDISGSDVARVYWREDNLERIKTYCEKDIATLAKVFFRIAGLVPIADDAVVHV